MPHNAVSVFNYAKHEDGELGSIWAQSLPGGCAYQQYWSRAQYGGYWQMPLDYLLKADSIEFPAIGSTKDRPVGTQMRHYLTSQGKPYTELVIFKNYEDGVDVYMRVSAWQSDLWSLYKIDDQSMPEKWHESITMRHVSNDFWPMDNLPDKKRKLEDLSMDDAEETLLHAYGIYETALHAMTSKSTTIDSPFTEAGYEHDSQL